MKTPLIIVTVLLSAASARADYLLSTATGPFEVGFRGRENTTYFGWTTGAFDADPLGESGEVLTTPPTTVGTTVAGIALEQIGTTPDILSGSNNLYNGVGANSAPAAFQLTIPAAGTVGAGFTTIIVQGNGLVFGGFPGGTTAPVFGSINGVAPSFVAGTNASGATQFWAKYELPGHAATYQLTVNFLGGTGVNPTSISDLRVDTQWSATGFAPDVAAVPEPAAWALLAAAGGFMLLRRARRTQSAPRSAGPARSARA